MRINEITGSAPDLYYHGTSTSVISAILRNGLLPEPPERVYDDSHGLASYRGVYLAGDIEDAESAADTAARTFGGGMAIIGVLLHRHETFIDEDRVWDFFDNYFEYDIGRFFNLSLAQLIAAYRRNSTKWRQVVTKMYHDFINGFGQISEELFVDVLNDIISTYAAAHPAERDRIGMGTVTATVGPRFRDLMQMVIDSVPGNAVMLDLGRDTVRVLTPIGFSGVPRIVWIAGNGKKLYGDPPRDIVEITEPGLR